MRKLALLAAVVVALILFASNAGRMLVVRDLRHADAIIVLNGESDRRPALGIELLRRGFASHALLDVSQNASVYHLSQIQIAEQYIHTLPPEISASASVCATSAHSTREEAMQARRCLDALGARSILIVTSEYHTRRARSIFRHVFPGYSFGVAGAVEPEEFGVRWWRHRQWAKTASAEWIRLLWWECVDRWR